MKFVDYSAYHYQLFMLKFENLISFYDEIYIAIIQQYQYFIRRVQFYQDWELFNTCK